MGSIDSYRLYLQRDVLHYDHPSDGWELPVAHVVAIGEYTNDAGPWFDDYSIVFVRSDGRFFEAPFQSSGFLSALCELAERIDAPLHPELCDSGKQTSRVMWPEHLAGQPLLVVRGHGGRSPWAGQRMSAAPAKQELRLANNILNLTSRPHT